MKRSESNLATENPTEDFKPAVKSNGRSQTRNGSASSNLSVILMALQTMRDGDFSVRLPGAWVGVDGKIADTFNDIVAANQQMAQELRRVGQVVGKEGRTRERTRFHESRGAWGEMEVSVNTLVEDLLAPNRGSDARHRGRRAGQLDANRAPGRGWTAAGRRVPAVGQYRQHDDSAARRFHGRSHARGARSGHRRQAGRAGAGARRGGHVEGPDRLRQLDGQQPDRPGAQHRGSDHRRGQRRPFAQDYRGRARRNSAAQRSHQHDGGPVAVVRLGSDARGARSGHRRQTGRPGRGARRGRHVEGPDRLGQRHGRKPHGAGAQHRRSHHGRGARRLVAQDHGGREGRNSRTQRHHQHHGGPAQRVRRRSDARGARSRHRRQTGRPGAGARRRRHLEGPDRQRELHGQQPDRPGAQHRRSGHGHRQRRPFPQDHRGRARRNSAAQRNAQHDGGPAQPVRRRSDARGARSGHRRPVGRTGQRARRGGHVERPDRLGELDGRQPDGAGAQHRRSDHGRGARRLVAQDHGGREGRNSRAEEHDQHDGGPAQRVRGRSDARGARGRHRRQTGRPGASARRRHVEGPHRQRELHGQQPDRPGAQHRRGGDGRGPRRLVAQDHGGREGRNSRAERHHQHDGGPVAVLRFGSDARGARSGHRRQAGRPGAGARRGRHVEGPHRLGQLHGQQPDRPGAQHRRSVHGHRQRRPVQENHRERERRNSAAQRNHQHDGGPAQRVRRRSDARGARSGHRRPVGRPGQRAGRGGHVEGLDRLGQLDGRQPDRRRCATSPK